MATYSVCMKKTYQTSLEHLQWRLYLKLNSCYNMYTWLKHKNYSFIVICTLQNFYIILCLAFFNYFNCLWFEHAHIYDRNIAKSISCSFCKSEQSPALLQLLKLQPRLITSEDHFVSLNKSSLKNARLLLYQYHSHVLLLFLQL